MGNLRPPDEKLAQGQTEHLHIKPQPGPMVRIYHEPKIRMNPILSVHLRHKIPNSGLPDSRAYMFDHQPTLLQ